MTKNPWMDNKVQFARLLCELEVAGAFTPNVFKTLCEEMDLTKENICELLDRAQAVFSNSKKKLMDNC